MLKAFFRHRRAIVFLAVAFVPHIAVAHDWYPKECCNDHDCAVITTMAALPGGELRVETDHGFAIAPRGFEPRPSPDNQAHACLRQIGPDEEHGGWMLICLFLPGLA
ncbi:MAG: hypothetical protein ABL931_17520 [Usitatibacteraceae bacterium]